MQLARCFYPKTFLWPFLMFSIFSFSLNSFLYLPSLMEFGVLTTINCTCYSHSQLKRCFWRHLQGKVKLERRRKRVDCSLDSWELAFYPHQTKSPLEYLFAIFQKPTRYVPTFGPLRLNLSHKLSNLKPTYCILLVFCPEKLFLRNTTGIQNWTIHQRAPPHLTVSKLLSLKSFL